jgi:NTP pyrophosphatase (non-canonical NTP hydrolase)
VEPVERSKQALEDTERWFGDLDIAFSIPHAALCLAGEAGEFANEVKKISEGRAKLGDASTRLRLVEELVDVYVFTVKLAGLLGIDLDKAYEHVRNNNDKRFVQMRKEREKREGNA